MYALRKFGAKVEECTEKLEAVCEKLHGTEIFFAGKSVGATEQAVLTAVSASGKTRIYNCAKEPEIIWLCRFLKKMGASIQGEGTEEILIEGGKIIQGADMQVPPDRIVAGTYLCAAAATRGRIEIQNPPQGELTDSRIQLFPGIVASTAIRSDCRSVGNPGYAAVSVIETGNRTRLPSATSLPLFHSYCPPILRYTSRKAVRA